MNNIIDLDLSVRRIDELCKKNGITRKQMLREVSELNGADPNKYKSIIDNMIKKSVPSVDKIAMIADYFKCSVDYLIGRTDTPNPEKTSIVKNNHNNIVQGINAVEFAVPVTVAQETQLDENQQELLKRFGKLSYAEKIEFMQTLINKTEKGNE